MLLVYDSEQLLPWPFLTPVLRGYVLNAMYLSPEMREAED